MRLVEGGGGGVLANLRNVQSWCQGGLWQLSKETWRLKWS